MSYQRVRVRAQSGHNIFCVTSYFLNLIWIRPVTCTLFTTLLQVVGNSSALRCTTPFCFSLRLRQKGKNISSKLSGRSRSINCEFNILVTFRQLLICAVVSFNLPTVSAFLERLVDNEGSPFDAFIYVRRNGANVFRGNAKLVISRVRI